MRLLVLPGDAIGPEISEATERVLHAADETFGLDLDIEYADIGWAAHEAVGQTMPQAVLDRVGEVDGTILGPVSHLDYPSPAEGGWPGAHACLCTLESCGVASNSGLRQSKMRVHFRGD